MNTDNNLNPHFDWNPEKTKINLQKHKLDYDEAGTIFEDPQFISFLDEEHSTEEERIISIGLSSKNRLLLVAHTEHNQNIRIISARKVTKHEE